MSRLSLLLGLLLLAAPASAKPFEQGSMSIGLAGGASNDHVIIGGGFGYFVVDGLELNLGTQVWFIGDPTITVLQPGVRYVLHFVPRVKPYVRGFFKHAFIGDGLEDADYVGVGGGILTAIGRNAHLALGLIYEKEIDCRFEEEEDCVAIIPELGISLSL